MSISIEDVELLEAMRTIKAYCEGCPTCDGCKRCFDHVGCYFRGKSPREWDLCTFDLEDININE